MVTVVQNESGLGHAGPNIAQLVPPGRSFRTGTHPKNAWLHPQLPASCSSSVHISSLLLISLTMFWGVCMSKSEYFHFEIVRKPTNWIHFGKSLEIKKTLNKKIFIKKSDFPFCLLYSWLTTSCTTKNLFF